MCLGCGTERRQSNQKTLAVLGKKHIYSQTRRQEMSAHRAEDMERDAAELTKLVNEGLSCNFP